MPSPCGSLTSTACLRRERTVALSPRIAASASGAEPGAAVNRLDNPSAEMPRPKTHDVRTIPFLPNARRNVAQALRPCDRRAKPCATLLALSELPLSIHNVGGAVTAF